MEESNVRTTQPESSPSDSEVAKWIGDEAYQYWLQLSRFIEQQYPGHAKQAGLVAAGGHGGGYFGRFTIIVDDDIDPTDTNQVLWAIGTRCDPETSIDIIRGCWDTNLDPLLPPEKREKRDLTHSIAIINACRPYHWKDQFPKVCAASPEARKKTLEAWKERIGLLK